MCKMPRRDERLLLIQRLQSGLARSYERGCGFWRSTGAGQWPLFATLILYVGRPCAQRDERLTLMSRLQPPLAGWHELGCSL